MKKTRTKLKITISAFCILLFAFCIFLTACGNKCEHIYDNACDATCNECGEVREVPEHSFTAFTYTDHEHAMACSACALPDETTKEKHTLDAEFKCKCGIEFKSELTILQNLRIQELYNQKDLLVKKITHDFGELASILDHYYDENGVRTKSYKYEGDGSLSERTVYEYDTNGYLTKKSVFSADDASLGYYLYENDDNGNCTKESPYDVDGTLEDYMVYEYDSRGNCTKEAVYSPDGTLRWYDSYVYDDNGNKTQRIIHSMSDNVKQISYYDKTQKVTKLEHHDEDGIYFYSCYTYNEDGREIKAIDYNSENEVVQTIIRDYYEDGTRKSYTAYHEDSNTVVMKVCFHPNAREKTHTEYNLDGTVYSFREYDEQGNLIASSD